MSEPLDPRRPSPEDDDAVIGRALRLSLLVLVVLAVVTAAALLLLRGGAPEETLIERAGIEAPAALSTERPERPPLPFTDVTRAWGIGFVHENGARGEKLLPETMGGGVAVFDLEGDGDQDLAFVGSSPWPHDEPADLPPLVTLYRNEAPGRFVDVTEAMGLSQVHGYGMGAAVADVDGDGDVDLYVTTLGPNRLLRNDGGRFVDVTAAAGVAGDPQEWSTSAGFLDHDGDGDLDLFVANYVAWSREIDLELAFTLNGRDRAYGPPVQYRGASCRLFRNEGGGRFTDASGESGVDVRNPATGEPLAKALAVSFADVDGDGALDVFVANDTVQNFLFRNRGDGTFEEIGARSGIAFDESGAATGAMGLDVVEPTDDGRLAVGIGNFANESSSLYLQQGRDWRFADLAGAVGVGSPSRLRLSFGLVFADLDLDGRPDLVQANGHLEEDIAEVQPSQTYRQAAQAFWNCSTATRPCFALVPEEQTGALATPLVGRGAAHGDLDGDGDLDLVLTQPGGPPLLLRNDRVTEHHWLRVRLIGAPPNRDAIGALVELEAGGRTQRRRVVPTRSYLSQVERTLTFGLGTSATVERLLVQWPDGGRQEVDVPAVDRTIDVSR